MGLTIALAKGYLLDDAIKLFNKIGIAVAGTKEIGRKLSFSDESKEYRFHIIRPLDVPVYVEHGAADLGICGKDNIEEGEENIAELLDLKFGKCQLIVAAQKGKSDVYKPNLRIATKFEKCAEKFFREKGWKAEIIKLYGSVELAPLVGLSDAVVDLTATGSTLRENNLEIIETIMTSTARLIANKIKLRVKYDLIYKLASKIQKVISKK